MHLYSLKYSSLLLILILFLLHSNLTISKYTIITSPIQVSFDQFSAIKQVNLRFLPETCFHKSDLIMISFSQPLQDTPTNLQFSLYDQFKKQLIRGTFDYTLDANINANSLQCFKYGTASSYIANLQTLTWFINSGEIQSQWLTIVLTIPRDLTNAFTPRLGTVNMAIVSSLNPQYVSYQWSNAMSYFYFASLNAIAPLPLITAAITNNLYGKAGQTALSTVPGALYPVYLQLTPTISYKDFLLNIQFTSLTSLAVSNVPQVKNFQFQGTCYFICQSTITCINAVNCTVKSDKIQVKINELLLGQKYVLRFTVLNPPYQATKNFLLWVDSVGSTYDMATLVSSVSTLPITVTTDQLKLFWKLPYPTVVGMGLGFFINRGINTVQVGFMINSASPFGQILDIKIDIGTSQLIKQSIDHNLPSVNTTISYDYSPPFLIIHNVTALTKINYRYWVAYRARHTAAGLNSIGSATITLTKYPTQILFLPLVVNTVRNTIANTDYRDLTGFHSGFKNVDTQVLSATDNLLQNGTSQAIYKYLNGPTTVGVDPSILNQQLLFLLKVPDTAFFLGTAGNRYDMRIYYNPNVFQSVSDKGVDLVAYKASTSKWQTFGNDCYQDQSLTPTIQTFMCQKYHDHVWDQQWDNVLNSGQHYYQFTCGNGVKVQCISSVDCKAQCTLFKGYSLTQGMGGIVAIRNATFISNYQSPVQASDKNLDFVICFYHDFVLATCSLINAYTVKFQPLQQTSVSLINTYHDGTNYNKGSLIPTLIKISGKLALSQYINLQYPDKMKIFLPNVVNSFTSFIANKNQIGCSYFCKINESFSLGATQNWLQMHSIVVQNIPMMTNDFKILIPVQLTTNWMTAFIGFQTQGKLVAVYRFGGSAVKQSIVNPITNIFTIQVRANLWNQLSATPQWTISPLPTCDYLQKINLQQTNSIDNFTIISMANSIMPYHDNPYITVTIRNVQILEYYTTILTGNTLLNRSCDKFNYYYNNIKYQAFVCQLYTNDNTTNNNIRIDYPIYNNLLGPGFPYDQVFTYGYASDVDGSLQGVKRELDDKIKISTCRTNKATQYNVGQLGRQLEIYRIQVDPIVLSSSTNTKLQIFFQLPNNIQPFQCSITQSIFNSKISCAVLSQTLNVTILQLTAITDPIKLLDFYVYINCYQTGAVTLSTGQLYKIKLKLPHTSATTTQVIYGSLFTPFSSIAYQCENSFTYINAAYDNSILINSHILNSVSLNLNTQLQFSLTFSKQKSHLLKNSYVQFRFANLQVTQQTFCYFKQFEHKFYTRSWIATSYKLYTNVDIEGFTANPVTVKCSNLILKSLSPSLIVKVVDITAANIQLMTSLNTAPYYVFSTIPYYNSVTIAPMVGVISAREYTTLGFNSKYTITYTVSGTGLVQGFIDLSEYSVDSRTIGCSLSIVQDVFCKIYQLNTDTTLQSRSKIIYFKTYFATAFTSIVLTIYPILQQKQITAPKFNSLILNNGNAYLKQITEAVAPLPVDDIFFINNFNLIPVVNSTSIRFNLQITYLYNIAINRVFYLQLNQILFYNTIIEATLKCTINTTVVPCTVIQKDLVQISTFSHTAGSQYLLKIQLFQPNYQIVLKDKQNFFLRMFMLDLTTKQIDYVSYLNIDLIKATSLMTLIKSYQASINKPSLIWNLTDSKGLIYLPKIYTGYYGNPINLIVQDGSKFINQFSLSSSNYTLNTFKCDMGYNKCQLSLIADSFNSVIKQYLFTHLSTYYMQPPLLQVQVSNQKCLITVDFASYKIFQNGMTLPIVLNFTKCIPRSLITIVTTLNSSDVYIDSSMSELEVTTDNPIGIIFVRHNGSSTTLVNYLLTLSLAGTYASSFTIPTTFTIQKIARTQSSIQAKQPQTLSLTESEVKLRIQCNEPSTVYWTLGLYPSTLGVRGQDIQTRLLNGQVGLRTYINDALTYGNLEYGLSYADTPNVWKQVSYKSLQGNSTYSFKYFCMNIKGTFSDGKILTFATAQSSYSMIKLAMGFKSVLNYMTVNNFACGISQSLVIPYNDTRSSVNTNCKYSPYIYYSNGYDVIWDYKTNGTTKYFYYNFYIKSVAQTSAKIISSIRDLLRNNSRLIKQQIPLWDVFGIQQIQPDVITPVFSGQITTILSQTSITTTFPISNQQSFVVVGLLSSYFNATSMSLPQTYMIKSGKFAQNVAFDDVYMNYTSGDIVYKFEGLVADSKYSIFYFITVDNPAINSKHSQVRYLNIVTMPYLQIDLFGQIFESNRIFIWIISIMIIIWMN